jgi:DNA primase
VIRFAELYHQVNFPQALTLLRQWCGLAPLLNAAFDFYRIQLYRYNEAIAYLDQRGVQSSEVIEHMRIGYAPGPCLRGWLTQLGYPLSVLQQAGLVTAAGYDSYIRCIIFSLESNLYGPSIRSSPSPHQLLPSSKGGLYLWEQVRRYPEVEGLFWPT